MDVYEVTGFLDGSAYAVAVGGPDEEPLTGSPDVIALLETSEGEPYDATPTGPSGMLDLADPASVLGALYGWTKVTDVSGDAPDIGIETVAGVSY